MKRTSLFIISLLFSLSIWAEKAIVLSSPLVKVEYQVISLSENGKWACGTINDGNYRGFCWNLETNEVTETSALGSFSTSMAIANDGTIAGVFSSDELTENGAELKLAGTWKDGKWTLLDHTLPDGTLVTESWCYGISSNAQNIAGIVKVARNLYKPAIWQNGELKLLPTNEDLDQQGQQGSVSYVNNDATIATGWTYASRKGGGFNRTATYWLKGERFTIDTTQIGPFCVAGAISDNSKYMIAYDRVKNLEKGTDIMLPTDTSHFVGYSLNDISDEGISIGVCDMKHDNMGGFVALWNGKDWTNLKSYLIEQGATDLKNYALLTGVGISADAKTFAVMAYDTLQIPRSLVIRLGVETNNMPAVALRAKQLEGLNAVKLTWKAPIKDKGITGYNVYSNGKKINAKTVTETIYVDETPSKGEISYTIKAVYGKTESVESKAAKITLTDKKILGVRNLIAEQSRINDVRILWNEPLSPLPRLTYNDYLDNIINFGGGDFSFECATIYTKEDLMAYKNQGYKISAVSFYPMSKQNSYTIKFYDAKDTSEIYTYTINDPKFLYGEENTVKLETPFEIPENKDIIMGITFDVTNHGGYNVTGIIFNKCVPGYTDLLRQVGDPAFFSLYENAQQNEEGAYEYNISWPMSMQFSKADKDNNIKEYKLYSDGKAISTKETNYLAKELADGEHTFEVETIYEDNTTSERSKVTIDVEKNLSAVYKPVTYISKQIEKYDLQVNWETPKDNDEKILTHSIGEANGGMLGSPDNQYNYFVGAKYEGEMLRSRDGYVISAIRFYPLCDAEFTLYLYENGVEKAVVELMREEDYQIGEWNTIKLEEPVAIDKDAEYFLTIDCYDVTPEKAPIAKDAYHCIPDVSELYSLDGESFKSVSLSTGIFTGNWMIGLVTRASEEKELPIKGYNVAIDNTNKNTELIAGNTFKTELDGNGKYKLNVNVVYDNEVGEVKSRDIKLQVNLTDIKNTPESELLIDKSISEINVTAETEIESMTIYSISGCMVAQSNCNTIKIDNLTDGIYVLKVRLANGEEESIKINL